MAKAKAKEPAQEILSIESSIIYVRSNLKALYPASPKQRKHTFGNIPDALHEQIMGFSEEHNLTVAETIASLWDFLAEYEIDFKAPLKAQRTKPKKRRQ